MKSRKTNFIMLMLSFVFCFTACNDGAGQASVKIGQQEWASKNLNVATFRNGDAIPEAKTNEEWYKASMEGKPAWCYYDNDPKNGVKYGKLYNWYAVKDPRGLAPRDWHVPSDKEWIKLTDYLGGVVGVGNKMKNKEGWIKNGNGSNESGFSGLPSGNRSGTFGSIGDSGAWWSSTEHNTDNAWYRDLSYSDDDIFGGDIDKGCGFSVRCVKN
ncbi:MAG: fibrobacter succinogenes major paralogous domain-containing protein [Chitinophagaceae bacterium]|nr:fibrobacter succinogenes major paralogous domain-containing protein [Chitinophagaceae bacterium]